MGSVHDFRRLSEHSRRVLRHLYFDRYVLLAWGDLFLLFKGPSTTISVIYISPYQSETCHPKDALYQSRTIVVFGFCYVKNLFWQLRKSSLVSCFTTWVRHGPKWRSAVQYKRNLSIDVILWNTFRNYPVASTGPLICYHSRSRYVITYLI